MKRILLTILLSFAFAVPSFGAATGERDIQEVLLDMFRGQIAELTDFDDELCDDTGTEMLVSTLGVWSCEDATDMLDHSNYLVHSGFQNDMKVSICGHNNTTDNCVTYNWYINTLGSGEFETLLTDNFGLGLQHLDAMNFGSIGKAVEAFYFIADGGVVTLDGNILVEDGSAEAPAYAFQNDSDAGLYLVSAGFVGMSIGNTQVEQWAQGSVSYFVQTLHKNSNTPGTPGISFTVDTDTGIYRPAANQVAISTEGTQSALFSGDDLTLVGQFLAPAGTEGAPSFAFTGSADTGMYLEGNDIRFVIDGGAEIHISSGSTRFYDNVFFVDGVVGAPAFSPAAESTTGVYFTTGNIHFTETGTLAATLNATSFTVGTLNAGDASNTFQILAGGDGVNAPGYSWLGDPDTGLMHGASANNMIFRAASGSVMSIWGNRLEMWQKIWMDDGGSLTLPGLGFRDDSNTGIWQVTDGDGDIDFVSDGVHAATLDATGLTLGAGTNALTAANVDVVFGGVDSVADAQHTHSEPLYSTAMTMQDSDGFGDCLGTERTPSIAAAGCSAKNQVGLHILEDAIVTHTRIELAIESATTDAECKIVVRDNKLGGAYPGAPAEWIYDGDAGNRTHVDFDDTDWAISSGDIIEFSLGNQGGTACTSTTAPYIRLTLYGYPIE
jgi:hypothetical protein